MTVMCPETTEEARVAVAECLDGGVPIAMIGSGTWSLVEPPETIVETAELGGIVDHRPDDLTVVVRAGTTLGDLEAALRAQGQTAVLPETSPHRTIGGVVASADSGYRRLRYGPTRDRVLGVTLVTGYGEVVHGGGRLVKNVTGYDLPRLVTGSMGALGLITEVCLKLWPERPATATVAVGDPQDALSSVYQPLAILETSEGTAVYLEGTAEAVSASMDDLGRAGSDGLHWPDPLESPFVVSVRVPAGASGAAVACVRDAAADRFIAQHGVGIIDVGFASLDADSLRDLRSSIGELGGVVVVVRWPEGVGALDRWGIDHQAASVARNMKSLFDPSGILNVGVLPGGI